jgi:hypothetical protein
VKFNRRAFLLFTLGGLLRLQWFDEGDFPHHLIEP